MLPAALMALAVAACQEQSDGNIAIDDTTDTANANVETLPHGDESDASANSSDNASNASDNSAEPAPPVTAASIPGQYHGRWGMVPADCTSTKGDNKGLITIGDKTVRFYEAVATLKERRPAVAISFSGLFGFTGEGQTWEKVMTFTRTGDVLKRAEEEGTFTYRRCA